MAPNPFFEYGLPPRFYVTLFRQAIVVQRQRGLLRHGLEKRSTPRALAVGGGPGRERHPAEIASWQQEGRSDHRRDT